MDNEAIELTKEEMDTVIDWMNKLLKSDDDDKNTHSVALEGTFETANGMTLEEYENQIAVQVMFNFKQG